MFENLIITSSFAEFRRWRRLMYVVIAVCSICVPLLALAVAAVGTQDGFPLPMSDRIEALIFALFPTHYIPIIAHRLLRRGPGRAAVVLAAVASLYLLPLFPFGTYGTFVMLRLLMRLRKAPVWLYAAKDEAEAMDMAREQLKTGTEAAAAAAIGL
jgi:hypothetical protein